MVLSVLIRYIDSDYPFVIFKMFLKHYFPIRFKNQWNS